MTSADKMGVVISIVAVIAGIAFAFSVAGSDDTPAPTTSTSLSNDKYEEAKAQIAKEQAEKAAMEDKPSGASMDDSTMSQEEQRKLAIAEQLGIAVEPEDDAMEETMEEEVMEETMEEESAPMAVSVSVPEGTAVPGCEETDECFIDPQVTVGVGGTVTWTNDDTAAHTVTSGTPEGGPDGEFDSSLFMGGAVFEVTFDNAGSYDYFCMVHPWMVGNVQVN